MATSRRNRNGVAAALRREGRKIKWLADTGAVRNPSRAYQVTGQVARLSHAEKIRIAQALNTDKDSLFPKDF